MLVLGATEFMAGRMKKELLYKSAAPKRSFLKR